MLSTFQQEKRWSGLGKQWKDVCFGEQEIKLFLMTFASHFIYFLERDISKSLLYNVTGEIRRCKKGRLIAEGVGFFDCWNTVL
jgi:hypothetical protein